MTDHVRSILTAAERLADAIAGDAHERAAARLREADELAARRLEAAEREATALVADRRRRLEEFSDEVIQRAERALGRIAEAEAARARLGAVAHALDEALADLEAGLRPSADRSAARDGPGESQSVARSVKYAGPMETEGPVHTGDGKEVGTSHPADSGRDGDGEAATTSATADARPPSGSPEASADLGPATEDNRSLADERSPLEPVSPGSDKEPRGRAADDAEAAARPDASAAVLVARDMAAAGSTRAEVAGHVRRAFQLSDPTPIVNEAFEQGSRRAAREGP